MEVKTGYKQTEVGVIPEDWDVRKLKSLVRSHNSGIYKSQAIYGHGYNIAGVSDIYGIEKVDGQFFANVPLSPQERAKHSLHCNDLLYGESSLVREGIARTVYVTEQGAGTAFAWHTRRYSIDQRTLLSSYLYYYLQTTPARAHMISNSIQTAITGINTVAYFACPTIVPPIAEQEAIAEALSDADALIESLDQLFTKKRQIKKGAMQELLRPKPSHEIQLLGNVSSLKGRIGWQGLKQTEFTANDYEPFLITGMNFKDGAIRWSEVYHISEARYGMAPEIQLRPNDVLMTKDGTIGKVLYIDAIPYPGKASLNSHLLLFRPIGARYNPRYLYYQLGSRRFKDFVELSKSGTTFFGLSQTAVAAYPVLLPPLAEQVRIATVLSDMDAEIAALEVKLAKARQIKQGMMQELLTGRIRLI